MTEKNKKVIFKEVSYKKLKGKQQEIYNFQIVAGLLAKYGFNCIKLADDWRGADFLASHIDRKTTLKIQLKSRVTIKKDYKKQDLYVTFPVEEKEERSWYLIEHDELVSLVSQTTNWLKSKSWDKKHGAYSAKKPNSKLLEAIKDRGFQLK